MLFVVRLTGKYREEREREVWILFGKMREGLNKVIDFRDEEEGVDV